MSHNHPKKHIPYCLNCHYPLAEFDSFCPNCGQKPTDGKVTMHDLLHELTHTLFHVDGKLFSTLKHIFIPGKLTEEFFKGHHKRYAHPVQLFLVLGATFLFCVSVLSHKLEEKVKSSLDKSKQQSEKKQMIAELDSSARQMSLYKQEPIVRKAMDSLLMMKLVEIDKVKKDSTDLQEHFFNKTIEIETKRLLISQLQEKSDSLKKLYPIAFKIKMRRLTDELRNLESDSIHIIETIAKSENLSNEQVKIKLGNYMFRRISGNVVKISVAGQPLFEDSISVKTQLARFIESKAQEEVSDELEDEIADLSTPETDPAGSFLNGVKAGIKESQNKSDKNEVLKNKNKTPFQTINTDSTTQFGVRIARSDMQNMEVPEIIEKYHVEGFWKRRILGATVMSQRAGQDKLHAFTSKSLWIIIFSLLPTAAFLWLLYRRQKRFFVEHVVWLLHVYCFIFIIFPLVFADQFLKLPGIMVFTFLAILWPFFAFKNYYKQSWRKTFVKYAIFSFAYFFISLFTFIAGGFLSFLFF